MPMQVCFCENVAWHTMHLVGFSPLCTNICLCKDCFTANVAWQIVHWWCLIPEWISICLYTFECIANTSPHFIHIWGLTREWVIKWFFRDTFLRILCHTQYICEVFLYCASVNVSLNFLLLCIQHHTIGIYEIFPYIYENLPCFLFLFLKYLDEVWSKDSWL